MVATLQSGIELLRVVLIALFIQITSAGIEENLRIVHVIWRHGARAPLRLFPLDSISKASKWPNGLGELTSEGMQQQLLLGKMLRERYKGFISKYTAKSVYARSTDTNRTIVSALVNLHGMFPSIGRNSPLNVSWQPIPVHTVPRRFDKILEVTNSYCPYPDSIFYGEVMTSEPVRKIMEENAELFNFLRNQTGLTIPTFTDIYDVYDPLNCERFHYKESSAPNWVSEELFRKIESLFKISTLYYYSHPIIRRFRGGPLLEDIATLLMRKANGTLDELLKYVAYSAHETTLIALLTNLDVYDVTMAPEFSACVMFELYQENDTYYVETWYMNGLKAEPVMLNLPGCPTPCDVRTFAQMASGRAPQNWHNECRVTGGLVFTGLSSNAQAVIFISSAIVAVVAMAAAVIIIFICRLIKRRKNSV
uniref:acid phosphatase n=1 Tax=Trichuris muris TaxID=70415 RepID=A0A5S6QQE1_TRIMR